MVTSVDTSLSVQAQAQPARDVVSTDATETFSAIQELTDQLKLNSSPAWLRGSSLATNAWIANSRATEDATSSQAVTAVVPAGTPAPAAIGPDPATGTAEPSEASVAPAAASSATRTKQYAFANNDMMIDAVIRYNETLKSVPELKKQLETFQAELQSTADDRIADYLNRAIASYTNAINQANALLSTASEQVDSGAVQIDTRNVTGTIYTRNADGTFSFCKFTIGIRFSEGSAVGAVTNAEVK